MCLRRFPTVRGERPSASNCVACLETASSMSMFSWHVKESLRAGARRVSPDESAPFGRSAR